MNSSVDGFVPLREKVVERPTSPWGKFTTSKENDAGRFKEHSSRKRAFTPRGKFTPLNEKIVRKIVVPRKKANEPVFSRERVEDKFLRGGYGDRVVPLSKRRFMPKDKITSPKGRFFP